MPVSAGSLYDYYNPFAGTQRNIANFADLYTKKKQMGMRERGLGLEEKRIGNLKTMTSLFEKTRWMSLAPTK